MSRDSLVPFSELQEFHSERLGSHVHLPEYVPADRIMLDTDRLDRIRKWSGLGNVFMESYDGDTTRVDASVSGVGSDGSAVAGGRRSISPTDLQETAVSRCIPQHHALSDYCWPEGLIRINTAEMSQRLSSDGQLRNPEAWSKALNKAVTGGMQEAATINYLKRPLPAARSRFFRLYGIAEGFNLLQGDSLPMATAQAVMFGAFFQLTAIPYLARITGIPHESRHISLIPGMAFDRLAVVTGLNKTLKLVKPAS